MNKLFPLFAKFGIEIKNLKNYKAAFTHPTYSNENREATDYQRLEFLGDSILGAYASDYIYKNNPKKREGKMNLIKVNSVRRETLAEYSRDMGFSEHIRFGRNANQLKDTDKVLEDVFEAVCGAIYLDGGREDLEKFFAHNLYKKIDAISSKNLKNPKTILQEYLQTESREAIIYDTYEVKGGFASIIKHEGRTYGKGKGTNKKQAEVNAAKDALMLMGRQDEIN